MINPRLFISKYNTLPNRKLSENGAVKRVMFDGATPPSMRYPTGEHSVYQGGIGDTVYIEITKKNDGSTFFWYWNKKKPYHFVSGEWYIGKVSSLPYNEHPIFQKAIIDMDSTAIRKEYQKGRNSNILDSSYYQYYLIRAIADSDGLKFEGFRY